MKTGARHLIRNAALWTLASLAPATVHAHTSYMLPNIFAANLERHVTVQSSFAEEFFRPEIAVDSDDFHVILPDGQRAEFENVSKHRQLVVLESPIAEEGTYRFTTGVRHGRVGKLAMVDGEWQPVRGDDVPANASDVKTSQTETVADVYISKKAPTRAPVDMSIGRLVIQPVTHPSDIYLDTGFAFKILFDGQPLGNQPISVDRGGARYDAEKYHEEVTTEADGSIALSFDRPGIYVVMTRHRADAPAGAETDIRSYTTSLTFEVQH